ncbi:MAG: hypothetical protein HY820_19200 [Acidobacteria bacterium]|nr:hypothetical protein [Acidobacteriota bacterium]
MIRNSLTILLLFAVCLFAQEQFLEGPGIERQRREWFETQRAFPHSRISPYQRLNAIRDMERMVPQSPGKASAGREAISSTQWTSIGPRPILSGTRTYSGRVTGIAVHPADSNTVYIGLDFGGVWKTTDGGQSWTSLTDSQPSSLIRGLALAPSRPEILYAGTRYPHEVGLLKTTDAGSSWTRSVMGQSGSYIPSAYSIAVHPTDPNIILAGMYVGVWRTTDGGANWTKVSSETFQDIHFATPDGSRVYASAGPTTTLDARIFRSNDGGLTWTSMPGAGATALPTGVSSIGFAVAPSDPNVVYAGLKSKSDYRPMGMYKSLNGGQSWVRIGDIANDNIDYWDWTLAVHPTNPSLVFAGLLNLHRSSDGGQTWQDMTGMHVDQQVVRFSNDGSKLYVGNDGGIYVSTNPSAVTPNFTSLNSTLTTAMFYPGISIHPTDTSISLGGMQDNGTALYRNQEWKTVFGGDGGWSAIDQTNPLNIYVTCQNICIRKSTDQGNTMQVAQSGIDTSDRVAFIPPFVMDPSSSSRLYFGTTRVYQTTNGASSWSAISPNLMAAGGRLSAVSVSPSDPNTVYAAGVDYTNSSVHLWISRNVLSPGASWTDRKSGLPLQTPTQVAVHPTEPLTAYVAFQGSGSHVFRTSDGGMSWSNVSANLPNIGFNDLLIDPDQPNTLYAASDIGVFRTLDAGQSWLPLGLGMPRVIVNAVKIHRPSRTLRAATHGRGMWDLWVPLAGQTLITISSNPAGAAFSLENGTTFNAPVTFSWESGADHTVTWLGLQPSTSDIRFLFQRWSDGVLSNPRTIRVPSSPATYSADVGRKYKLTLSTVPAEGGTLAAAPAAPDGFYDVGASVTVTATAAPGYTFWYYSGGIPGSPYTATQTVVMDGPKTITSQFYCTFTYSGYFPSTVGPGATSGLIKFQTAPGCSWSITGQSDFVTLSGPLSGVGSGIVLYSFRENTGVTPRNAGFTLVSSFNLPLNTIQEGIGSLRPSPVSLQLSSTNGLSRTYSLQLSHPTNNSGISTAMLIFSNETLSCNVVYSKWTSTIYLSGATNNETSTCRLSNTSITPSGRQLTLAFDLLFRIPPQSPLNIKVSAFDSASSLGSPSQLMGVWDTASPAPGLRFVPLPPCRIMETRSQYNFEGRTGAFGPPSLTTGETRTLNLPVSNVCNIPSTAKAYVTNVTVIPSNSLDFVTVWPAGDTRPNVWTIRSPDGQIVANSAIVAAGASGGISVYASHGTDLLIDISGYYTDSTAITGLAYYPTTPCRVIDTRILYRSPAGPFGPPSLNARVARNFRIPATPYCSVPSAAAYSATITVVPPGPLAYLTAWPGGAGQPNVSSINSFAGRVLANSVIIPAAADGSIDVFAYDATDFLVDINGYYAADDGQRGLFYFPVKQCRASDSTLTGGPYADETSRTINIPTASGCSGIPATAQGYAINVTALPDGNPMPFLTAYPSGQPRPNASILNAFQGQVVTNAAIIPAGTGGAIDVFAFRRTGVVVEVSGYFGR